MTALEETKVEEVKAVPETKFMEESKAPIVDENEDLPKPKPVERESTIDKIIRESEEAEERFKAEAERILGHDTASRAEQAAISKNAKFEVDKFAATKEGVAETKQAMDDFIEEFDKTAQKLAA